ncbi:MAG: hypothetical protein ACKO6F_08530 [Cyanobium sp.]
MVNAREDHRMGQAIADLLRQHGPEGLDNGRIQASLNDLLGSDTALVAPLRDLLSRPAFRQLLLPSGGRTQIGCREGLLDDLSTTYSPVMVKRFGYLLDGVLGLPLRPHGGPQGVGAGPAATEVIPDPLDASSPLPPSPSRPGSPPPSPSAGILLLIAALVALLALLSGAVVVGVGWILHLQKGSGPAEVAKSLSSGTEKAADPAPASAPEPEGPSRGTTSIPTPASTGSGVWGDSSAYKFGQLPGGEYPNSCAFTETTAAGTQKTGNSSVEYWACRDEGGNASDGYQVVWADGKRTRYTFGEGGAGVIIGTNGRQYPMQNWRNDTHNGDRIIVINHEDGATTWIPGHVEN